MFNSDGSYSPPDEPTRHVAVLPTALKVRNGLQSYTIPAGTVTWEGMVPFTHYTMRSKQIAPNGNAVLIEHSTANVGDVLPESEVEPAIALAKTKLAAVTASQNARRKGQQK